MVIPIVSSENRSSLPIGSLAPDKSIVNYALLVSTMRYLPPMEYAPNRFTLTPASGSPLFAVKMKTDFAYSNTLGWNTFPVANADRAEQVRPLPVARKISC